MRSAYLGQFTDATANAIAAKLEAAGIAWSYKQAGRFSRMFFAGDWGTRMFVDSDRLDEARRLAAIVEAQAETLTVEAQAETLTVEAQAETLAVEAETETEGTEAQADDGEGGTGA